MAAAIYPMGATAMRSETRRPVVTAQFVVQIGDCRARLKDLPDCSIDSIVTDPPYELGFMGKAWDSTGIAYDADVWCECLRVLKQGGHLLAFGGSRTYHRMACAIEDAGFQIRDQIMWVYGSGFPKSHNLKDEWAGWGTALKPAHEPIVMARKPLDGSVANNVLTHGTGGIYIDGSRVKTVDEWLGADLPNAAPLTGFAGGDGLNRMTSSSHQLGRWPANFIHDGSDEVLELFPQVATRRIEKPSDCRTDGTTSFDNMRGNRPARGYDGDGSAARFFYCAKASKRDRDEGLGATLYQDGFDEVRTGAMVGNLKDGSRLGGNGSPIYPPIRANHHPTVKPTELMRYLCRLVTPPNGTVLDPFTGSGSTGKAAILEGFNFIGIELSADYAAIAVARITACIAAGQSQ